VNIPKAAVNTLVDKTKGLKIETLKKNTKQIATEVDKKSDISKTDRPFGVDDIDKKDHSNPFMVAAYAKDIYSYLRKLEVRPVKIIHSHAYLLEIAYVYMFSNFLSGNSSNSRKLPERSQYHTENAKHPH